MSQMKEYEALSESFTDADRKTALENRFPYIYSKAALFLKMKPEIYRKNDFFAQPPAEFDEEDIAILKHGCEQVLEGKGFKKREPVHGTWSPDCITLRHMMDESEVTYYNFCE